MVPPMGAMLALSVNVEPLPTVEPLMVHVYDMDKDSPSGSLALDEQEMVSV